MQRKAITHVNAAPAVPAPSGVRVLLALGVENALVLVLACTQKFGELRHVGRYADDPLPRLVGEVAYFEACPTRLGPTLYTVVIGWPGQAAGPVLLGCVTAANRKPLLSAQAQAYTALSNSELRNLLRPLGKVLAPAFTRVLPPAHALHACVAGTRGTGREAAAVVGCFDGVTDGFAQGWAWSPARAGHRHTVEVLHQGRVVGRGRADNHGADLAANGLGDGCHHFKIRLSHELFDGAVHELHARVVGSATPLAGSPRSVELPREAPHALPLLTRAEALSLMAALAQRLRPGQVAAEAALLRAMSEASLAQETGQPAAARAAYEHLLRLLGPNALCHRRIAETWLLQQRPEAARAAYEAALRCEPNHPAVLESLRLLQQRPSENGVGMNTHTGPLEAIHS